MAAHLAPASEVTELREWAAARRADLDGTTPAQDRSTTRTLEDQVAALNRTHSIYGIQAQRARFAPEHVESPF